MDPNGPMLLAECKWYGGLLGLDGCAYGIPNCAESVLKIDPKTQDCQSPGIRAMHVARGHGCEGSDYNWAKVPGWSATWLKELESKPSQAKEVARWGRRQGEPSWGSAVGCQ